MIFCFEKDPILGSEIWKKAESPKMTSKVLYELLIRSYERFKYFSRTWNLTISKSTSVNQRKCGHHGKINFNREKTQKCNIRWSQMTSPWGANWGKFKKKLSKKCGFREKNIKKLKVQKWHGVMSDLSIFQELEIWPFPKART